MPIRRSEIAAAFRIALVMSAGLFVLAYVEKAKAPAREHSLVNPCLGQYGDLGAFDYEWQLTALDGRELSLTEFRGKVIFLNVWATWCPPCVDELPAIERLHEQTRDDGIVFVLVSNEEVEDVRRFTEGRYALPFYVSKSIPAAFGSKGIPATFVINEQGRVVFTQHRPAAWDSSACQSLLHTLRKS